MGIMRIKKILLDFVREEEAKGVNYNEVRLSERHKPLLNEYFKISLNGSQEIEVVDFSFGGFSVKTEDLPIEMERDKQYESNFKVLDQSIKVKAELIHQSDGLTGFRFIHKDPENLIFLRQPVESISQGSSMLQLNRDILSEKYRDADWYCFRGNGPTDLVYRVDEHQQLIEALLTFFNQELLYASNYVAVDYKNGQVRTFQSVDSTGDAARMSETTKFDNQTVRQALQILSGVEREETLKVLKPFIDCCRRSLPDKEIA